MANGIQPHQMPPSQRSFMPSDASPSMKKNPSNWSRVYNIWLNSPTVLKLSIPAAMTFYSPWHWSVEYLGIASSLWIGIPKDVFGFCLGRPTNLFGRRWDILNFPFPSPFPKDVKTPLMELDKKISVFETQQAEPPHISITPQHSLPPPTTVPRSDQKELELQSNKCLEVLTEKISYLSLFKAMHVLSGAPECNSTSLFQLVNIASRPIKKGDKPLSLWTLFIAEYGNQTNWWGRFKARCAYWILWQWIPIIPKMTDSYMKHMLSELRSNLKENSENRKRLIEGFLEDLDNFLDIYNGAAIEYAKNNGVEGNLNSYRRKLLSPHMPQTEDLCKKLSRSIIDHFSPMGGMQFRFAKKFMNWGVRKILRDYILPQAFLAASTQGELATKKHNIPFFLALTQTLTEQISDLRISDDTTPIGGAKHFESIVKKLMRAVDISSQDVPGEVKEKLARLDEQKDSLDAKVREGIQEGAQIGLAILFDYLSKQENTEKLFTLLLERFIAPLSGQLPLTDEEWRYKEQEYINAKIALSDSASSFFKKAIQKGVRDRLGSSTEIAAKAQKSVKKIFTEHQERGQVAFANIEQLCIAIQSKLSQLKPHDSRKDGIDATIHPELKGIVDSFKEFENIERIKITMDQNSPSALSGLSQADQESILRVLHPIYQKSNQVMDHVLSLQMLQKQATADIEVMEQASEIHQILEKLKQDPINSSQTELDHLKSLYEILKTIPINDRVNLQIDLLGTQINDLCDAISDLKAKQKSLTAFDAISKGLDALAIFSTAQSDPRETNAFQMLTWTYGFKKRQWMKQIEQDLKIAIASKEEQKKILEMIEKMQVPPKVSSAEEKGKMQNLLNAQIRLHKDKQTESCQKAVLKFNALNNEIEQLYSNENRICEDLIETNKKKMHQQASVLKNEISILLKAIEQAKSEDQIRPAIDQFLGQILGFTGFVLGASASHFGGKWGRAISAFCSLASMYVIKNPTKLENFPHKLSFPALIGGIGGLASFLIHRTSPLTSLVTGTATSASLEYAGRKGPSQMENAAVDIILPKIDDVFSKAYNHLFTNDQVLNGIVKLLIKQFVDVFPPKN